MEGSEVFVFLFATVISLICLFGHFITWKPRLFLRDAAGAGLVRLAFLAAIGWIVYVLYHYADPSVVGIYRLFYIVLGFAVLNLFGHGGAGRTGVRYEVDVIERHNAAAGLLIASFILGTGMIFGGSLWGEADPDGEGEGGWWIPMGFFLAGWIGLLIATWLYRKRECRDLPRRMRQIRDPREVLGFALYILSTAWVLTESVAGDFYGWRQGLTALGAIAGMLIAHEIIGLVFGDKEAAKPRAMTFFEVLSYLGMSAAYMLVNRYVLPAWGLYL
jgi:hypothetical protein